MSLIKFYVSTGVGKLVVGGCLIATLAAYTYATVSHKSLTIMTRKEDRVDKHVHEIYWNRILPHLPNPGQLLFLTFFEPFDIGVPLHNLYVTQFKHDPYSFCIIQHSDVMKGNNYFSNLYTASGGLYPCRIHSGYSIFNSLSAAAGDQFGSVTKFTS